MSSQQVLYTDPDRGIVRLYDGTVIYIIDIQYSADGKTYWESTYNPLSHMYEGDGVTQVEGHKYMRVKHAGDTNYQAPMYITAEDGDNPELQVTDTYIQWKLSQDTVWINLIALEDIKGDQGEKGDKGEGWHINSYGALDTRPACCSTAIVSTGCGCSATTSNAIGSTYMSLGNHKMTTSDIGNGTTYWHTVDGITWVQSTASHEGLYVNGWLATAAANGNSDALTCNSQGYVVLFTSLGSPYLSIGKVYACADGVWTENANVTTPTGLVKVSTNDNLEFLEDKVDGVTIESYDSDSDAIEDKIRVKDDGIDENKISSTSLGNGLTGGSTAKLKVLSSDIDGYGLSTYTSLGDSEIDLQVYVQDFISHGLTFENVTTVDGEQRDKIVVDVASLIDSPQAPNTEYSGLKVITETDTYNNIAVAINDGLKKDTNGVSVVADELSLEVLGRSDIRVYPTDSLTKGIQALHIHENVVDVTKGLEKANATTGKLGINVDSINGSLGFNGAGELTISNDGVKGIHLNPDTADNNKGLEVLSDTLAVKVDGTTIGFNGSGQLEVDSTNIGNVITATSDVVIKSITANDNGTPGNVVRDDVTLRVNDNTGIIANIAATSATDTVVIDMEFDTVWGDARYALAGGSGTAWGTITGTVTNQADLIAYIDGLNHLEENTVYGSAGSAIKVVTGAGANDGLQIQSPDGTWFKLIINNDGNLDTVQV